MRAASDAVAPLHLAREVAAAGGQPLRFRQMAKVVNDSGEYLPESSLQRSVVRLESGRLIEVDRTDIRLPLYRPTAAGQRTATLLTFVLDAFEKQYSGDEEPEGPDASDIGH